MHHTYKLSNTLMDSKNVSMETSIIDNDGTISHSKFNVTDFKIIRALISKMQSKYSNIVIQEIEKKAFRNLTEKFENFNLSTEHTLNSKGYLVFADNEPIRDVLIAEESRKILKKMVNKKFEFSLEEIFNIIQIKSRNAHYVRKKMNYLIFNSLCQTIEHKVDEKGNIYEEGVSFTLIGAIRSKKGKISLSVQEDAVPYLFGLTKNYTPLEMISISKLNSLYSVTLYEQLKKIYKIQKKFYFPLEDLKNKFNYTREYKHFKAKVLNVAIKELKEVLGMEVKIREKKEGNNVSEIGFDISNTPYKTNKADEEKRQISMMLIAKECIENEYSFIQIQEKLLKCIEMFNSGKIIKTEKMLTDLKDNLEANLVIGGLIYSDTKYNYLYNENLMTYYTEDEIEGDFIISGECKYLGYTAKDSLAAIQKIEPDLNKKIASTLKELKERNNNEKAARELTDMLLKILNNRVLVEEDKQEAINKISTLLHLYDKHIIEKTIKWLTTEKAKFDYRNTYDVNSFFNNFKKLSHKAEIDKPSRNTTNNQEDAALLLVEKLKYLDNYFLSKKTEISRTQQWISAKEKLDIFTLKDGLLFDEIDIKIINKLGIEYISENINNLNYPEHLEKIKQYF